MPKPLVPPLWALLTSLGMLALHQRLPGPVLLGEPWSWWLGVLPALAGVGLVGWAARLFLRAGTPLEPWQTPTALVVSGPYRFTRNPMYLGLTLCLIGLTLWLGTTTPALLLPVFVALLTLGFVRPEERRLEQRFGKSYRTYKSRVRRWI
jgi:protein-S-isoprenylcysteine O-methyltransferase Ste14